MLKVSLLFCCFFGVWCQVLISQIPTNGLIAHYDFNQDLTKDKSTIFDQSKYSNHGSIAGGVSYTADRFGVGCSALYFDGTGYVSVPSSNSLKRPRGAYSAVVWFKLAQGCDFFKQWITICCKSDQSDETAQSPQYRMQATAQTFSINTEFTENFIPQLSYEVWYFYACTFDGSKVRVFLNGKFVFEFDYFGRLEPNDMPLEIGRDLPGGLEYYFGTMDDLLLYDRALDGTELLQIYQDNSGKSSSDRCITPIVTNKPPKKSNKIPDPTNNGSSPTNSNTSPNNNNSTTNTVPDPTAPASNPGKIDPNTDPIPDPQINQVPVPPVLDSFRGLPVKIGNIPVKYQEVVHVKNSEVKIYPYDNEKEDGDIVSINVNGVWVRDKYELKNKKINPSEHLLIKCSLNPGEYNYFVTKAWNVGTIPPNTLTIEIDDGVKVQKKTIYSEVGLSGGIKIVCDQ